MARARRRTRLLVQLAAAVPAVRTENNERDQLCQTGETGPLRPPAQPPPDTSVAAGRPSGAPAGAVTDERAPPGNHGRATAAMANYGQSQ